MEIDIKAQPEEFIRTADKELGERIARVIDMLEEFGHLLRMPYSKSIYRNIFELRSVKKHNVRLIYTFRENRAIIFYAFHKKEQRISTKDLHEIIRRFDTL